MGLSLSNKPWKDKALFGVFSSNVYRQEAVEYHFRRTYEPSSLVIEIPRRFLMLGGAAALIVIGLAQVFVRPLPMKIPAVLCEDTKSGPVVVASAGALSFVPTGGSARFRTADGRQFRFQPDGPAWTESLQDLGGRCRLLPQDVVGLGQVVSALRVQAGSPPQGGHATGDILLDQVRLISLRFTN